MSTTYTLHVKQPIGVVAAFINELCGNDSVLRLVGDLTRLDGKLLEQGTVEVVTYDAYTSEVLITLSEGNCQVLTKGVLPRAGIHWNIHEIEIMRDSQVEFVSYDNFSPQATIAGQGITTQFLKGLVTAGQIKCFYPTPIIDDDILEGLALLKLMGHLCSELPEVETIGPQTLGYVKSERKVVGRFRVVAIGCYGAGLERLPDHIAWFEKLRVLSIAGNRLRKLGKHVTRCTDLQVLYANDNRLEFLPETLGRRLKLRELDLSHNQLTTLPYAFGDLTSLERLNLRNNKLEELPPSFANLASLRYLDIRDNPLTDFTKKVLALISSRGCHIEI